MIGELLLATTQPGWCWLPRCDCILRDPENNVAALDKGSIVLGPVTHAIHLKAVLSNFVLRMDSRSHPTSVAHGQHFSRLLGSLTVVELLSVHQRRSERAEFLAQLDRFNINAFSLFGSEESLMETLSVREYEMSNG